MLFIYFMTRSPCTAKVTNCDVQENASLFEDAEVAHVYKGTFTAEYQVTKTQHGWRLTHNNVIF